MRQMLHLLNLVTALCILLVCSNLAWSKPSSAIFKMEYAIVHYTAIIIEMSCIHICIICCWVCYTPMATSIWLLQPITLSSVILLQTAAFSRYNANKCKQSGWGPHRESVLYNFEELSGQPTGLEGSWGRTFWQTKVHRSIAAAAALHCAL